MKSAILVVMIAASIGGLASSSEAQVVKKLPPHPAAAADPALRLEQSLPMASVSGAYVGSAASTDYVKTKPVTGEAVSSGGSSTSEAKHSK